MRGWPCTMNTRLGEPAWRQGDRAKAEACYRAALELAQELAVPATEDAARAGLAEALALR